MKQITRVSLAVVVALIFVTSFTLFSYAQTAQMPLTRHVRQEVASGQAPLVGKLPASETLLFDIMIPLRDRPGLQSFIREQYNPASPFYHLFLTPEEVTERYGPSQEDWDALVAFAKASGFEILGGTRDGRDLWLRGAVANIEKAFHVSMNVYQDPTEEGRTFFATDREPTTDLPFQLWHITGLDNNAKPHPLYVKKSDYAKAHGMNPEDVVSNTDGPGSGPSSNFLGSDMRAAYYGGTALTGAGQNIGLFELAGSDLADLATYYSNIGQTEPYTPTLVSTGGYATACLDSGGRSKACDDVEQTIDMQQAMGMAPGSTMTYMYVCGAVLASGSGGFSDSACISAMVTTTAAPLSKQIGCSWGWSPADTSTLDPYFEQMASQGQNFFVASGDSAKWSSSNTAWPADDANVVAVGGTDLTTVSAGGAWSSETAWADSGGGNSTSSIPIPSWQTPVDGCSGCSKTLRNGPDVSAMADFYFYYCGDQTSCGTGLGGTSFAAPMWAGYLALANQQAAANGESIGYINPIIYPQAELGGTTYSNLFHDITSGSCGDSSGTGYDLCTGWGSPNGSGLINLLAPTGGLTSQTITWTTAPPSSAAYYSTFNVAATASSGLAVTITGSGECSGSGSGSATITMNATSGTCTVTASQAGNSTYAPAPSLTPTVTATAASQTISWTTAPPSSAAYYSTFNVVATASSGLAVTIAGSGECSGSGSSGSATITMNATSGTCTVTASQTGNTYYAAATSLTPTVSPTQAAQTISWTSGYAPPSSAAYYSSFTAKATASSGLAVTIVGSGECSGSGSSGSATITMNATSGTCTVTASQTGNTYYAAATSLTPTVSPTQAAQIINFTTNAPSSAAYGQSFTVAASASSGLAVAYTSSGGCSNSGATYTMTSGTTACSVIANQSGNTYYAAATQVTQSTNSTLATSSVSVGSSQNPSFFGQSVTFTATINGEYGQVKGNNGSSRKSKAKPEVVSGSVTWSTNTGCGTTAVTSGVATCTTSTLPLGTDTVTATYSGDSNHSGSSGTLSGGEVINQYSTSTAIASTLNPASYGQSVSFTANVTSSGGTPTGTVQFNLDGSAFGSPVTLSSGSATSGSTSTLAVGTHTVTAVYSGAASYAASTGTLSGGEVVNSATAATVVTSSLNPTNYGQSVTFTATINGEYGLVKGRRKAKPENVTGTVTWSANTGCGTTAVTSGNPGTATCTTTTLPVGTDTITATYSGDSNHSGSSGTLSGGQVVNQLSTSTAVAASLNPSVYGQTVSFTANVTSTSGTPTGTVQFNVDGSPSGSPVTLSSGSATSSSTSTLAVGTHTVTATYSGATNYAGSAGTLSGGEVVNSATAATVVTSNLNPSTIGQSVTFTATINGEYGLVKGGKGHAKPEDVTGSVTWSANTGCGTTAVSSGNPGTAACTTSTLPVGSDTITATYSGDSNHSGSTGTLSEVVNQYSTSTAVASTLNPATYGQSVSFTANVTSTSGTPTGTVQFNVDGSPFGSPVTLSSGSATSNSTSTLAKGTHTVTAVYSGATNYAGSTGTLSGGEVVSSAAAATVVTSSLDPTSYGQSVTFTATINGEYGLVKGRKGHAKPEDVTGTVTWSTNTGCGTTAVTSGNPGVATCTTSTLPVGTDTITATYSGDSNHSGSTGTLSGGQVVNQLNTSTAVGSSLNPATYGQSVSFTANVTSTSGTPTGTVQFSIDGSAFGSPVALSSGSATSTSTSTLAVGTHTVTAAYSGATNYTASTGTLSGGEVVTSATSSMAVASSSNPSVFNQSVTFTATINGEYGLVKGRKAKPENVTGTVTWSTNTGCGTTAVTSGNPGVATCATSSLPVGTNTITATYSGDSNHGGGTATLSGGQVVDQAPSTTAVASSLNPATYGQSVSFTANVTSTGGTPTGTVQFNVDGSAFGSPVALASGSATSGSTSTLAVGTHTVTAVYSGDTNFPPSTGTLSGGEVVNSATAATVVTSSQNPSGYSQSVTFTATINGEYGLIKGRKGKKPEDVGGTVTWSANTGCGTTTVTSGNPGVATCTTSTLASGTDTITAAYSGDSNHSGSTGTLSQVVNQASTTAAVASSLNPSTAGQGVNFTASVTSGAGTPTGTVQFNIDGSAFGSPVTLTSGSATSGTTSALTVGTHTVTAVYSGATNYAASTATLSGGQVVNPVQSQTITFNPNPPSSATYNTSFTVSATASSGLPVAFTSAGSCANVGATYTMNSGSGTCFVIANQAGNAQYSPAPQLTVSVAAVPAAQTITVAVPAPPAATYHSSFTVAASASSGLAVAYSSSGACTNSGATYTITKSSGTCTIIINQPGNSNYAAAPPVVESTTVAAATTPAVNLTGEPTTALYGSAFPVTASSNETGPEASIPVITTTTPTVCSVSGSTTSGTSVTATVTMLKGTGTCTVKATWAANYVYAAATASVKTTAAKPTPIVSFTGAPATITHGNTFTVDATSNESGAYVSVPTITTSTGTVCTVGTVTPDVSGGYQATVTTIKAGTCKTKAAWATNTDYLAASASQSTTVQ